MSRFHLFCRMLLAFLLCLTFAAGSLLAAFPAEAMLGEPEIVPGIPGSSGSAPGNISISPDGKKMVFINQVPHRLFTADWDDTTESWTNVRQLPTVSGYTWENTPSFGPFGEWIYFHGSWGSGDDSEFWRRKNGENDSDYTVAEPVPFIDGLRKASGNMFDGSDLYFSRLSELYTSEYDPDNDVFGIPVKLSNIINNGSHNNHPFVADGGLTLVFSRVTGSNWGTWKATRASTDADWNSPVQLGLPLKTGDRSAWYSPARSTLYFMRWTSDMGSYAVVRQCRVASPEFAASDFEPPMGKKKKVGSTLPIKFQLFFEEVPVQTQEELNAALDASGCDPACPQIVIEDVTDEANQFGIELPSDDAPDGGGDSDTCFRFDDDGKCIYNLKLNVPPFAVNKTYMVSVKIGNSTVKPKNEVFQTKAK